MNRMAGTGVALDDSPLGAVANSGQVLRTENLRKIFHSGNQEIAPLDGIDFSIERGEMIAIVGAVRSGQEHAAAFAGGAGHSNERCSILRREIASFAYRGGTG